MDKAIEDLMTPLSQLEGELLVNRIIQFCQHIVSKALLLSVCILIGERTKRDAI